MHSTPAVAAARLGLGTLVFERLTPPVWLRVGQAAYIVHCQDVRQGHDGSIAAMGRYDIPLAQCPGFLHWLVHLSEKK
jgi:hypothetical protein